MIYVTSLTSYRYITTVTVINSIDINHQLVYNYIYTNLENSSTLSDLQQCFLLKIPKYCTVNDWLAILLPSVRGESDKYVSIIWCDSRSVATKNIYDCYIALVT